MILFNDFNNSLAAIISSLADPFIDILIVSPIPLFISGDNARVDLIKEVDKLVEIIYKDKTDDVLRKLRP